MKQCPLCKNTYTDDSLSFCLSDGTTLTNFYDSEKTQALPSAIKPTEADYGRLSIPVTGRSIETQIAGLPAITTIQPERKGCSPILVVGVFALFGIIAVAGIVGTYFALKDNRIVQNITPTPTATSIPSVSPSPNSNTSEQELKDKLEKLQKQLDEQKKAANKNLPSTPPPAKSPTEPSVTAKVNSPDDGFLAMRSGPSHKTGYQIMKMPHGASVNVYNCQASTSIAGKTGRWCQVSYGGYNGWAFDAWLIY